MPDASDLPLSSWRFAGTLRSYQRDILDRVALPAERLHIVAPPGAGKTLVGLLLAMRDGRRAMVFAPTVTIRRQWARTARTLVPAAAAPADAPGASGSTGPVAEPEARSAAGTDAAPGGSVSEAPEHPADFTALTYQMISVVGDSSPFDALARETWVSELVAAGRAEDEARAWVDGLEQQNATAWRAGIRRRAARARKASVADDPEAIARVLHPNAVALIDLLVRDGVRTVILDECHHLLDHWALVVRYLAARIRATGDRPLLIGLTATLPSDDDPHYDNYADLLGPVDYEIPTPAVIREGNLAPSRDIVWFTEPTGDERAFLRRQDAALRDLLTGTLATDDGRAFLHEVLLPPAPDQEEGQDASDVDAAIGRAFDGDFALAASVSMVLSEIAPGDPLVPHLPAAARRAPQADDLFTVVARYALGRILPDPARAAEWQSTRRVLADFGYQLTDRGMRRGRNAVEQLLATSAAKDAAAVQILHHELSGDAGDRVRAAVVTDFASHGNARGNGSERDGALRCFATLAGDPVVASLNPVLVTAQHLRACAATADALAVRLGDLTGAAVTVAVRDGDVAVLQAEVSSSAIISALNVLVTSGEVRVLVGTRGLLGEGWDCPALNTLIDLTATATSAATQQLRGRTLRLDPAWPGKVAHNWTVTCLLPARLRLDGSSELRRLDRKHEHLWGVDLGSRREIVTGLRPALTAQQMLGLIAPEPMKRPSADKLTRLTLDELEPRAETWTRWGVGQPYADVEGDEVSVPDPKKGVAPFRTGLTLVGVVLVLLAVFFGAAVQLSQVLWLSPAAREASPHGTAALTVLLVVVAVVLVWRPLAGVLRAVRRRAWPQTVYVGAVQAIADTFADEGKIRRMSPANVSVEPLVNDGGRHIQYDVGVNGGSEAERRLVADAVAELFGPVERPRFLLRVDRGPVTFGTLLTNGVLAFVDRLVPRAVLLPVPAEIGRRRETAERFARHWARGNGPCQLHELRGAESVALLARARRGQRDVPGRRRVWA